MGLSATAPRMPRAKTVAQPTATRGRLSVLPRVTQPVGDPRYTTIVTYTIDKSCIPVTDWWDLAGRVSFTESCIIVHALDNGTITQTGVAQ